MIALKTDYMFHFRSFRIADEVKKQEHMEGQLICQENPS